MKASKSVTRKKGQPPPPPMPSAADIPKQTRTESLTMKREYSLLLLITCLTLFSCAAYKPVVIVHGVWDLRFSLNFMAQQISEVGVIVLSRIGSP